VIATASNTSPLIPNLGKIWTVSVLFARSDSVYKSFSGIEVYDVERDARTYAGAAPVVAHPPCRAWGRLRGMAKPRPDEKDLALFAVDVVRRCGGVLEHPEASSLWPVAGLPRPGAGFDAFGGWTLPVSQKWWGHRAEKRTWLYIRGVSPARIPRMSFTLGDASRVIASGKRNRKGMPGFRSEVTMAEREATPPAFARWLIDLAQRAGGGGA